ncbi:MAG TPA: glycosyl hydrolase [Saprospiraceae bacterium]|nr:glycosyl hydrolase [Saprospiraceae bacterium]
MKNKLIFLFVLSIIGCTTAQKTTKSAITIKNIHPVDSLLALMTTEEKIGQMTLFTSDWESTGPTMRDTYKADIRAGKVGAIFNAHTAAYTRSLQKMAVEETRLGIPLLFGYDVIHGYRTIFPISLGEAASWDLAAIQQAARIGAIEASAAGLHWTFAPMVDIARDPRWGRISEGAGEDTYLGNAVAGARVKGFQGANLTDNNTILACAKHFAAYGAAQAGRDYNTVDISDRTLREIYLPPFKAAIDAGVRTFMTSFNELNGIPATGNKYLLKDILRDEWKFDGMVVTDYTSINEMVEHGNVANEKEAGELALKSGVDMDMQGAVYYKYLKKSLAEGKVTIQEINQAARNVLMMKYELGLFDDPYKYSNVTREKELVFAEAHRKFARRLAQKSIVLLKNKKGILPLPQKSKKKVAVIGPLADSQKDMLGSWSASGHAEDCVTLKKGLQEAGSDLIFSFAKGCNIYDGDQSGFAEAKKMANDADYIILSLGENRGMSGEAASRSNIGLPGHQLELAKMCKKTGKPMIVVLSNGRPLAIPWIAENADAIVETWFLGTEAGHAMADVLLGKYNPSGKLPVTFPRNVGQVPIFYNAKHTGRPFDAKNKYTSKYLDVPNTPLYPFGYGLSYTSFDYGKITTDKRRFTQSDSINISVIIKNTGDYDGTETVQLYIHDLVGSVTRPVKELKGFQQVKIKKGAYKTVTFTLTKEDFMFYDKNMKWTIEPGKFDIYVGTNSSAKDKVTITYF